MHSIQLPKEKIRGVIGKGGATIRNILGVFGCEVNIDGLLHVSEMAPYRVANPADEVSEGQEAPRASSPQPPRTPPQRIGSIN